MKFQDRFFFETTCLERRDYTKNKIRPNWYIYGAFRDENGIFRDKNGDRWIIDNGRFIGEYDSRTGKIIPNGCFPERWENVPEDERKRIEEVLSLYYENTKIRI